MAVAGRPDKVLSEIAGQLGALERGASPQAIRFVIMCLYSSVGPSRFASSLLPLFEAGPAAQAYETMVRHYAVVQARRREQQLANDPQEVARRREERQRRTAVKLADRAERKRDIDRAWRESQASGAHAKEFP